MVFDKDLILDIIYPRRCPLCGELLGYGNGQVCRDCLLKLKMVEAPRCFRCGKTIDSEELEYCQDCFRIPKSYVRGYPVFNYTGNIKKALYDFKYKNQRVYSRFFCDCIYYRYKDDLKALALDGIVPVPIHKKKKKSRGYNQAELIASHLGEKLMIPVFPNYLIRVVNTNPQKELSDKERLKNLKNAFKIGTNKIKLNKVLLVDDIYTSGATIEACTRVLLESGVKEVYYTSIAIGQGF
ncbi:MAG: ComF family protein [Lachnospiraceae bacterium]